MVFAKRRVGVRGTARKISRVGTAARRVRRSRPHSVRDVCPRGAPHRGPPRFHRTRQLARARPRAHADLPRQHRDHRLVHGFARLHERVVARLPLRRQAHPHRRVAARADPVSRAAAAGCGQSARAGVPVRDARRVGRDPARARVDVHRRSGGGRRAREAGECRACAARRGAARAHARRAPAARELFQ